MSCLAPPTQAQFLSASTSPGAAYYADAAIARALHFSTMPEYEYEYSPAASSPSSASAPSSSSLLADFPYVPSDGSSWFASTAAPPTVSLTCDSVLVCSDATPPRPPSTPVAAISAAANKRRAGVGPNAGRAGKRRARASKRAPTTYISTDPANFRLMVQHVTGVQAEPGAADGSGPFDLSSGAALLGCHASSDADADAAALHRHHQQQLAQQQCYPTLDSWSVLYESSQQML
ncbi:hypothetical protein ZWY2020_010109 [Hordeum vulgare]|nr:hypothetical protein ZWY2020_010109 [Hordeum vulgare]